MSTATLGRTSPKTDSRVVYAGTPDQLADIYRDEINLVIWKRHRNSEVDKYVDRLLVRNLPTNLCIRLPVNHAATRLVENLPVLENKHHFIDDVIMLLDMYACLFDLEYTGVRITTVDKAMCPRFHVDKVPCRLITTYGGAGTEWIPGHGADSIRQLDEYDVGLFKGSAWEGNEDHAVIHRSPTPAVNTRRLLLTLDFG
jgi:hypothetical protein